MKFFMDAREWWALHKSRLLALAIAGGFYFYFESKWLRVFASGDMGVGLLFALTFLFGWAVGHGHLSRIDKFIKVLEQTDTKDGKQK